jgi:hypothetical protein
VNQDLFAALVLAFIYAFVRFGWGPNVWDELIPLGGEGER